MALENNVVFHPNYEEIMLAATKSHHTPCAESVVCDKSCIHFDLCLLREKATQKGFTEVYTTFSDFIDFEIFSYVRDPHSADRLAYKKSLTEIDINRQYNDQLPHRRIPQVYDATYRSEFTTEQQLYVQQVLDFVMQQRVITTMKQQFADYIQTYLALDDNHFLEERAYMYTMQNIITQIFQERPELMPAVSAVFTTFGTGGMSVAMETYFHNRGKETFTKLNHRNLTTFFDTRRGMEYRRKTQTGNETEYAIACPFGALGKASLRILENSPFKGLALSAKEIEKRTHMFKNMLVEIPRHALALTHLLMTTQDGHDHVADTVKELYDSENLLDFTLDF